MRVRSSQSLYGYIQSPAFLSIFIFKYQDAFKSHPSKSIHYCFPNLEFCICLSVLVCILNKEKTEARTVCYLHRSDSFGVSFCYFYSIGHKLILKPIAIWHPRCFCESFHKDRCLSSEGIGHRQSIESTVNSHHQNICGNVDNYRGGEFA